MDVDLALVGGLVFDGVADDGEFSDVWISDGRVVRIAPSGTPVDAIEELDCTGRLVVPGFIDAHSHADSAIFDEEVQLALLRQGVTTVVVGQDGVSFSPGDGSYASEYFKSLNGHHPTYRGSNVSDLLRTYDGATPVNVAYLVPAGTVRALFVGSSDRPASAREMQEMRSAIESGLSDGAVGVSTGLDYSPGFFADTHELVELCRPLGEANKTYVTHMRGGYEECTSAGISEVIEIGRGAACRVHVSHLHAPPATVYSEMRRLTDAGLQGTFDAYPYRRGFTLLAMLLLPATLTALPRPTALEKLNDPTVIARLARTWFPSLGSNPSLGPAWARNITYADAPDPKYSWVQGLTLEQASNALGKSPESLAIEVIRANQFDVSAIVQTPAQRTYDELAAILMHPSHALGSDGIYLGKRPHPRAYATFSKFLRVFVTERADLTWGQAVKHTSTRAAEALGLSDRGSLREGNWADIAVIDSEKLKDGASYELPRLLSDGIEDVLVNGTLVLQGGKLTGRNPGQGLRY